jgi:hypothetical protein
MGAAYLDEKGDDQADTDYRDQEDEYLVQSAHI